MTPFFEGRMKLLAMGLALASFGFAGDPPACECGASLKIADGKVTFMWKDKEISSTPIVSCHALILGKDVDLTKGGSLACPCGKTVKYAAQMELKHWTGASSCDGVCAAAWTVTDDMVSWSGGKFPTAAFAHDYKIKNHKVKIAGEVDLLKDKSFNCL